MTTFLSAESEIALLQLETLALPCHMYQRVASSSSVQGVLVRTHGLCAQARCLSPWVSCYFVAESACGIPIMRLPGDSDNTLSR